MSKNNGTYIIYFVELCTYIIPIVSNNFQTQEKSLIWSHTPSKKSVHVQDISIIVEHQKLFKLTFIQFYATFL